MRVFLAVLALLFAPPSPERRELPPRSLTVKETIPPTALDEAVKKLSRPCPYRLHANGFSSEVEEIDRFLLRPHDLYNDCADEMDALVKTREPIDERLLRLGEEGKGLPERYRAAWILIRRRNGKVVPILEKMAGASSAEERYLAWHAYEEAVRGRQVAAARSFDAALAQLRRERNQYLRVQLMDFLGACQAKEAVPLLTAVLKEDEDYFRNHAVGALGEIGDPQAVPAILELARKEWRNRGVYFWALGRIGSPEAVDYLLAFLDESSSAAEALFESGSPRALPALETNLDRLKKTGIRDDLALAVTQVSVLRLKYQDPRGPLIALAEDPKQSPEMHAHALEALGRYDQKPLAGRILTIYRTDRDDRVRMFCIRLLRELPGKDITDAMIDQALTDDGDGRNPHFHKDLVQALNQRLNTSYRSLPLLVEYLRRQRAPKGT